MSPRRKNATSAHTERREQLLVLLARSDRGVLSRIEARLLRAAVEAELADGDQARRSAGGQQAAARRAQRRIEAAEQTIRELEDERDELARTLRALCAGEASPRQALSKHDA